MFLRFGVSLFDKEIRNLKILRNCSSNYYEISNEINDAKTRRKEVHPLVVAIKSENKRKAR